MIPKHLVDEFLSLSSSNHPKSPVWATGKLLDILRWQDARVDELEAKIEQLTARLEAG